MSGTGSDLRNWYAFRGHPFSPKRSILENTPVPLQHVVLRFRVRKSPISVNTADAER
jgi:hypothetical protein